MKKTRKGLTLVEVIVAIAVFTIVSLALFSSYLGMRKVVFRQEEYARLEMVCYDINYYWDAYGEGWANVYFAPSTISNNNNNFKSNKVINELGDNPYTISWTYENDQKVLIITSIKSSDGHEFLGKPVNCGESEGDE